MTNDEEGKILQLAQEKIDKVNEEAKKNRQAHHEFQEKRLKQITPELLSEFLIERGASQHCLSCGSSKLFIPETQKSNKRAFKKPDDFDSLSLQQKGEIMMAAFDRFVTYSRINCDKELQVWNAQFIAHCTNCGFMMHYRAQTVVSWFEQKQGLKEEQ